MFWPVIVKCICTEENTGTFIVTMNIFSLNFVGYQISFLSKTSWYFLWLSTEKTWVTFLCVVVSSISRNLYSSQLYLICNWKALNKKTSTPITFKSGWCKYGKKIDYGDFWWKFLYYERKSFIRANFQIKHNFHYCSLLCTLRHRKIIIKSFSMETNSILIIELFPSTLYL